MAKVHRNDIGSVVLDRATTTGGGHFRHWSSSFRRKIFDAVSCGGSSRYRHHDDQNEIFPVSPAPPPPAAAAAGSTGAKTTLQSHIEQREPEKAKPKSEKLSDLLNLAAEHSESENDSVVTERKVEALEELKRVAKALQEGDDGGDVAAMRKSAAGKVRLLAKDDVEARATLAMLGVIPPLVGLLDSGHGDAVAQIASLYALLNLGIGNDVNKAAILQAGAVHKMLKLIESPNPPDSSVSEAIIANFLGLSALDSNKPVIGASGAIPFLVKTLKNLDSTSSCQAKQDALRALYNLSIFPSNISFILETDLVPFFLSSLGDMEVSERILAILSNMVSVPEGRKAISSVKDAFPILVDALNWNDSPGCQEKASYILMVMAHKAFGDRQAMIEAGMVSALLELTLLGSTLAQKRASRILECLRVDKGKQVSESFGGSMGAAVSAPICGSSSSSTNPNMSSKECMEEEDQDMMSEEKKAVKQLVQQSLQSNMRRIVKRANLPQDFVPSDHFKSLTSSSTSKSLPF